MPLTRENVKKALDELRRHERRNFNQSLELIIKLKDVDLKKPENRLNESVVLPHPIGKPVRVCVIAGGDLALKSKEAKADLVIGKERLEELAKDKKASRRLQNEYDFFIAEASLMPLVGRTIGSTLGPRGKMPIPVRPDASIHEVIEQARRTVRIRVRDQPVIQCRVGCEVMSDDELAENIQAAFTTVEGKLERGQRNISAVMIKTTMESPVSIPF
ncbi:MAG: 50S ribosomal protein L1 [Candidatus Bathyarchaeia archaeon]